MKHACLVYGRNDDELLVNIDRSLGINKIIVGIDEEQTVIIDESISTEVREYLSSDRVENPEVKCRCRGLLSRFTEWLFDPHYEVPLPELLQQIGVDAGKLTELKQVFQKDLQTIVVAGNLVSVKKDEKNAAQLVDLSKGIKANVAKKLSNISINNGVKLDGKQN